MAWIDLIRSINRAAKILGKEITEQDMPDSYEGLVRLKEDLWGQVNAKRKGKKMDNPGNITNSHRKLRIALIELKTDIEAVVPSSAEVAYRETLEATIDEARNCNLKEALNNLEFATNVGRQIEKRLKNISPSAFYDTLELTKAAIIEALTENCKCELRRFEDVNS